MTRVDQWWRDAVVYQVYPRSFADSDGDGEGDLPGVTARLEHLRYLGVDALWLSPFYPSPQADGGYDVADYRAVDPRFGTLADVDALLDRAAQLGLRVLLDLVPNHCSDQHPWFSAALRAAPGSAERDRYVFRDGTGPGGRRPPNNWQSVFGGPAWTRVLQPDGRPGQWYLHLFDAGQPDWNWRNEAVREEFRSVLQFWLDRGVAGFRVDVAHGLVKRPGLPDHATAPELLRSDGSPSVSDGPPRSASAPMWDQDEVHDIYADWRSILDGYPPPARILCGEAWVTPAERLARYVAPGRMHQAFTFDLLDAEWDAADLRRAVQRSLEVMTAVGAPCTWVLSSHDVVRHASRLGLPGVRRSGIRAGDPQPDRELGLRRARALTALVLALPGAAYLYQGEELGLPEHTTLPDALRQDPAYRRSHGAVTGRDGCRVPLPWAADAPGLGFGPSGRTWLPQPASYREYAADRQRGVAGSTLELYRTLLTLRREHRLGRGTLTWEAKAPAGVLACTVGAPGRDPVRVVLNLRRTAVALRAGARLLAASVPLADSRRVPPDVAVWTSG